MPNIRERHLKFLNEIKEVTGLSLSALAKKAAISDTTLTRFVKQNSYESLSNITLSKVSKVAGFNSYEDYLFKLGDEKRSKSQSFIIPDSIKFQVYEDSKRLLAAKVGNPSPVEVTNISTAVIETAKKLNTEFISDSLIMYVIEKEYSSNN